MSTAPATSSAPPSSAATSSLTAPATGPTVEESAPDRILATMTLQQKAAQCLLLAIDGTEPTPEALELMRIGPPGGILLLGRNVTASSQVSALVDALQQEARAQAPHGLGLLVAVDQEGGSVARIKEGVPSVPPARELGDSSTPHEAALLAAETARGLGELGINVNLAPVADVVSETDSFLYSRSYGGDASQVAAFVGAVVEAYEAAGILSVPKHFPGHGSSSGDTHTGSVPSNATLGEFESVHLVPFRAAIAAGARGIMVAHVTATALDADHPASLSPRVIGNVLRRSLGFEGLVVADDLAMAAAGDQPPVVDALLAGCDLLILTSTYAEQRAAIDAIVEAVVNGALPTQVLDAAVTKVLEAKASLGLLPPD